MTPESPAAVRPRTAGEILDDAWRLYQGDAALLLALAAAFTVPAALGLLVLLTAARPESLGAQPWLPALVAACLPLTGLGSAAVQHALRQRADGKAPVPKSCLRAAARQGLEHAAVRAVWLTAVVLGLFLCALPGLALWAFGGTAPVILAAGDQRFPGVCFAALRQNLRQPAKTLAVAAARLALLLFAVLNGHFLVQILLGVGEHLAGLDVALASAFLTLDNSAYLLALVLFSVVLLTPYAEACHFLLHADARARFEGLDLDYRVRQVFPAAAVLALAVTFFLTSPALSHAEEGQRIRAARQEIQTIRKEIRAANPYPGGSRWEPRLREILRSLEGDAPAKYRGFRQALEGFGQRRQGDADQILTDLEQRLGLIEDALPPETPELTDDQLRGLLPNDPGDGSRPPVERARPQRTEPELKRPVRRDDPAADGPPARADRGPGLVAPQGDAGLGTVGWLILAGLFAAVLAAAAWLGVRQRQVAAREPRRPQPQTRELSEASVLARPGELSVTALWQQADDLAQAGDPRAALRTLYLAVLALLHQANRIRAAPTRTNGEYARQLRPHPDLAEPFAALVTLVEGKWFGDAACAPADYARGRSLADRLRAAPQRQNAPQSRGN